MLNIKHSDIEKAVNLLDGGVFTIPGTNIAVGLDALIGLLPVAGDTVSLIISLRIIVALVTPQTKVRDVVVMLANVLIDYFIGSIPIIGDIFDLFFKANRANLEIARKYHEAL